MRVIKRIWSAVPLWIFLSAMVHTGMGFGLTHFLQTGDALPIVAELDLSMAPNSAPAPLPPPPPLQLGPPEGSALGEKANPVPIQSRPKKQGEMPFPRQKVTPISPVSTSPVISEAPFESITPSTTEGAEMEKGSMETVSSSEEMEVPEERFHEGLEASASVAETGSAEGGQSAGVPGGVPGGTPEGRVGGVPGGQPGGVLGGEIGGVQGGQIGGILEGAPGGAGIGGKGGRYLPVSQVAKPPRWVGNFIRSSDYPLAARRKRKDGKVVVAVFIDETGQVRDVRLLQGSDEALNAVALRKVRGAIFTPALNEKNQPVACKVTLPIRFQLQ